MAQTLQSMLSLVPLTKLIESIKTGIPDLLPPAFHRVSRKVIGDAARYTMTKGTRKVAQFSMYGAPASSVPLADIEEKDVKLLHAYNKIQMKPLVLQALRAYTDYSLQNRGKEEVARQTEQFRAKFDNLSLASMYMMLGSGYIYYDGEGHLLPTSSGAKVTVDFQVPANNRDQLNGIITASWANNNTDIPLQIRNLHARSLQQTGYPLKHAFYGVQIPGYFTQNSYVLDYMARTPMGGQYLDKGEIPQGLFGLNWHPVYTSFWQDKDGTNQSFFDGDTIVFTPEIDSSTYELIEGSFLVPTTFNPVNDLMAANSSFDQRHGLCSWALASGDPPSIWQFFANTWLPTWLIPESLYIANVTP